MEWQINPVPLCRSGAHLTRQADLSTMQRLTEITGVTSSAHVALDFVFGQNDYGNIISLDANIPTTVMCQRCMEPMTVDIALSLDHTVIVQSEADAYHLPDHVDACLLDTHGLLDLWALVEDELMLSLPLVPMHETCPNSVTHAPARPEVAKDRQRPFEDLAKLLRESDDDR
jgi:uncharacterized protein